MAKVTHIYIKDEELDERLRARAEANERPILVQAVRYIRRGLDEDDRRDQDAEDQRK